MRFLFRIAAISCLVAGLSLVPAADEPVPAPDAAATEVVQPLVGDDVLEEEAADTGIAYWFENGGRIIYVLSGLGILALLVITERIVTLQRGNMEPGGMARKARDLWSAGDDEGVRALAQKSGSPLAQIIRFCVDHRGASRVDVSAGVGDIAGRAMSRQLQKTYWLAVIATLSPLLGLLGTVLGMIEAFQGVAIAGDIGDVGGVAGGIAKALITTAAGLIVAVPALAGFHFFRQRTMALSNGLEETGEGLINAWFPITSNGKEG